MNTEDFTKHGKSAVDELIAKGYVPYNAVVLRGPEKIAVVGAYGEVFWIQRPDVPKKISDKSSI